MRKRERIKRNKRILKLRENPNLTLEDIGEKEGLTAAGVARVLERNKEKVS